MLCLTTCLFLPSRNIIIISAPKPKNGVPPTSLSDDTLEIGCSIMTDGIKDFVQRNAGIPCERFSREEFFDIKTECNEFDPIYDECRASDFFWATAAVEFAGIDKMTLKEVLAAV